jgi:K+-transporting ATPase KdpF subunit
MKPSFLEKNNGDRLAQILDTTQAIWEQPKRRQLFIFLIAFLCFSVVIAPAVLASTGGTLDRSQAYALAILGLGTFALSIYLFVVMFQPERF